MTPEAYDRIYASEDNWQYTLTSEDEENLQKHQLRVGDPIVNNQYVRDGKIVEENGQPKAFQPHQVKGKIQGHWQQIRAEGVLGGPNMVPRFRGEGMEEALRGMYIAMVFGRNVYIEGCPGSGKTSLATWLARNKMGLLIPEFSCSADATDLQLVGGEVPIAGGTTVQFGFNPGPVTRAGAFGLLADELPRLPTQTSNVLLEVLAERLKRISLVASKKGDHVLRLSPAWFLIATGNPVSVGGQAAERSQALWERIQIGLLMPLPSSKARLAIYQDHQSAPPGGDPMAPQLPEQPNPNTPQPPPFTFREARAAMQAVKVPNAAPDNLGQFEIMIAACHAVSPAKFRGHYRWKECPYLKRYQELAGKAELRLVAQLQEMVHKHLDEMEGSNPRCEIAALDNARCLALLRPEGNFEVTADDMAEGFKLAHRARLRTLPGDEAQVEPILDLAKRAFWPGVK
jgi:hypothetical protein